MKELLATVNTKGQVTIPAEVRRALGVSVPGKVAFLIDGDEIRVARRGSVVQRTAGSMKAKGPARGARQLRAAAEAAMAEEAAKRMGR
jgi:AbrB family looped-hinge helix DNA binding protein